MNTADFFFIFLQNAMSLLSHFGFLNYFGPQRFGLDDKEVNACDIGLAMLQGDMVGCFIENRQGRTQVGLKALPNPDLEIKGRPGHPDP